MKRWLCSGECTQTDSPTNPSWSGKLVACGAEGQNSDQTLGWDQDMHRGAGCGSRLSSAQLAIGFS